MCTGFRLILIIFLSNWRFLCIHNLVYLCHHWTTEDREKLDHGQDGKTVCTSHKNYMWNDHPSFPGCGGCWCCRPMIEEKGKKNDLTHLAYSSCFGISKYYQRQVCSTNCLPILMVKSLDRIV